MAIRNLFVFTSIIGSQWLAARAANPADLPSYSSGSLRGSEAFLGSDGNPVTEAASSVVSNPQYVPGQKDTANLGLYLDFQDATPPQPARGNRGGTDPSHRTFNHIKHTHSYQF
jgi:hypothetical protein